MIVPFFLTLPSLVIRTADFIFTTKIYTVGNVFVYNSNTNFKKAIFENN